MNKAEAEQEFYAFHAVFRVDVYDVTGLGTRPWTNRFTSASTTIVSSSPQSHMVDPDWIQIFNRKSKATPTCL